MTSTVHISEYSPGWASEYETLRAMIADALGDLAVRIDHIGSTSIPGMDAKDIIDIQITVLSLDDAVDGVTNALVSLGFEGRPYLQDHEPPGWTGDEREWSKRVFAPPADMRRCNIHLREAGRANQRYALLFRDYMRSHAEAVTTWIALKRQLASLHPDDLSTYGLVKDAATDVLMLAAEEWADAHGWEL
jgi:GrpB-like predicted nucleotidyltransferase (UPF0157 family)